MSLSDEIAALAVRVAEEVKATRSYGLVSGAAEVRLPRQAGQAVCADSLGALIPPGRTLRRLYLEANGLPLREMIFEIAVVTVEEWRPVRRVLFTGTQDAAFLAVAPGIEVRQLSRLSVCVSRRRRSWVRTDVTLAWVAET